MKIEDEIKSTFECEHQKALVNLMYTNFQITASMRDHFKQFDITAQQFNILRILRGQSPNACSIGLLKERMLDKSSDVSRIVDRLLLKKLIQRTECKTDRRQKDIMITKKGLDLLKIIDADDTRYSSLINLSLAEAEQLNTLLDKVRD